MRCCCYANRVFAREATIASTIFDRRSKEKKRVNRSPCGSPRFRISPLCVWRACIVPARRPKFLSWFLCFMVHFINLTCGFTPDSRCRKLPQKRQLPASETSRGCSQKQVLGHLGMSHRAEAVRDLIETRILRPGLHGLWWWRISKNQNLGDRRCITYGTVALPVSSCPTVAALLLNLPVGQDGWVGGRII